MFYRGEQSPSYNLNHIKQKCLKHVFKDVLERFEILIGSIPKQGGLPKLKKGEGMRRKKLGESRRKGDGERRMGNSQKRERGKKKKW